MDEQRNDAIELGLPNTPEVSDGAYQALLEGNIVNVKDIKTLNDFKLLQMGWVYDVNFTRTFQIIRDRGYIEMIYDSLPSLKKVNDAFAAVMQYLNERCQQIALIDC